MKTIAIVLLLASATTSFTPQDAAGVEAAARRQFMSSRQESFMAHLKRGDVVKAYDILLKDSPLNDQEAVRSKLVTDTEVMLKALGEATDADTLDILFSGKHEALGEGVLCFENQPIHFYFSWYRHTDRARWKLTQVWFSGQPRETWEYRR